ncbi:gaba permease [Plectosphaerella plurivora]|uniref:Gaba permease n=1 Tax=Plectosphaerella plurivora TaxID=936078 RepID=A0A9P8VGS9_9PEZI|nr:gaba permease [Plectosphaerella plurivora]
MAPQFMSQDPGAGDAPPGYDNGSTFATGSKKNGEKDIHRRMSNAGEGTADATLESLGYKPELTRNRSTWQVAFMSFVLASIPYGLATTLYYPLVGGGPVVIIWGWLAVSLIIACVAASLGEITSVYPTAGGVYYQAFMLAPSSWRRVASWICGWLYVVGNITITLAVNFGTAMFLVGCINVFQTDPEVPVIEGNEWQLYLIFLALTFLCNAISAFGNKWLPMLDTAAIFWTFAGVLAIIVTILAMAKNGRHSAKYVFTDFEPTSGWPDGWSFMVGLLHAGYATSSTGMIISMCEEVRDPARQVPKAMVATIFINMFAGLLFLIPLVFVLPDIQELVLSPQPVPIIILSATANSGAAFALCVPLLVLAVLCGVGCTTAASRCTWAFSRDGAIPGSRWWKQINHKLDVPFNAMMLSMAVQIVLGLLRFGSAAAFNAFSGVGVISLTAAYATPIAINLFNGRKATKDAKFSLGKFGVPLNVIALAWSALAMPLFCMPATIPVTADLVNYAPVVFVAACLISGIWYIAWGHKNYAGPPTHEAYN